MGNEAAVISEPKSSWVGMKPIADLLGRVGNRESYEPYRFFIPRYQRGYRWSDEEVKKLLEDLQDFQRHGGSDIYCLQPLVVQKRSSGEYAVIDGQQRLTTLFIVINFLEGNSDASRLYTIKYETRERSEEFLRNIGQRLNEKESNIDFYHMARAYETVKSYFGGWIEEDKEAFLKFLYSDKVCFIFYEADKNEDPIAIFTRLNIGKIPLTDTELIKALLLQRFPDDKREDVIRREEMAAQWDEIQKALQKESLWHFLSNDPCLEQNRMSLFFTAIRNSKELESGGKKSSSESGSISNFLWINELISRCPKEQQKVLGELWDEVWETYCIILEWQADILLYHYTGFLLACPKQFCKIFLNKEFSVGNLLKEWKVCGSRRRFLASVKADIYNLLNGMLEIRDELIKNNKLGQSSEDPKTNFVQKNDSLCVKQLLLFHNLQTMIDDSSLELVNDKYPEGITAKFPFHLYKLERWDKEHINPVHERDDAELKTKELWLLFKYQNIRKTDNKSKTADYLVDKINEYFHHPSRKLCDFEKFFRKYYRLDHDRRWSESDNESLGNFVLLDSGTNRSYKNAVFGYKRQEIICRHLGKSEPLPEVKEDGTLELQKELRIPARFFPPCTLRVFLKYYSKMDDNGLKWSKADAQSYENNIRNTLENLKTNEADRKMER